MKGFKDSTRTRYSHDAQPNFSENFGWKGQATPTKAVPSRKAAVEKREDSGKARAPVRKANGGPVSRDSGYVPFDEALGGSDNYTPASAPSQTFKEAFASNRAAGKSTFTWNGKKYTTEVAGAPKAVQSAPRPAPKAASVPVPSSAPRISAPAPKAAPKPSARDTFRENFQRAMGDDSPAAKAALDAKAAARGRALKGAVDFITKGDGKKHPSFRENFQRAMKTGGSVKMTAAERRAADEQPSRPLTRAELAAARPTPVSPKTPLKAVPPTPRQPRVTEAMYNGIGEDRAPGEKRPRFAVGGPVPTSGGMPAQGKPLYSQNMNDARVRPPGTPEAMPAQSRPLTSQNMDDARVRPPMPPRPAMGAERGGLPQSWRDNYAADSARRLGANPQPTARDLANRAADVARSGGKPPAPTLPPVMGAKAPGYKKGGKVFEKGTGETYGSKGAKAKHEGRESYSREMAERRFGKK